MQAAEAGNLEEFIRLYQFDNARLIVKDGKGRTVAHQAAARNKINILQFIRDQNGGKNNFHCSCFSACRKHTMRNHTNFCLSNTCSGKITTKKSRSHKRPQEKLNFVWCFKSHVNLCI